MFELVKSATFDTWLRGLRDARARARIAARLDRVAYGNFGDVKPIGHGISECGSNTGPATACTSSSVARYLSWCWRVVTSAPQHADIQTARRIASDWERES